LPPQAATERFLDVATLSAAERNPGLVTKVKNVLAYHSHNALNGIEPIRVGVGAGHQTRDNPKSVADYQPVVCTGGLLDRRPSVKT